MRPEEPAISPAADLKSWRHIRDLPQIDAKTLQQPGRITADRDPGPDFPKFGVLLENLHRLGLLQEKRSERKATYAPADNGNVTRAGHICSPPGPAPEAAACLGAVAGAMAAVMVAFAFFHSHHD
jgi:hypothetical protein